MHITLKPYEDVLFGSVVVGNNPTRIVDSSFADRKTILLYNNTNNTIVYIGKSDLESGGKFPLEPKSSMEISANKGVELYAMVESGSVELFYIEGR